MACNCKPDIGVHEESARRYIAESVNYIPRVSNDAAGLNGKRIIVQFMGSARQCFANSVEDNSQ